MLSTPPRWAAIVAALAVVAGCSSSSPTSPGTTGANLPPATGVAPTPKSDPSEEKLSIKGRVVDARTGEALARAAVVVQQVEDVAPQEAEGAAPSAGATDSATGSPPATADAAPARPAPKARNPRGKLMAPVKTTADEKGHFEIKDLPPGTYAVTAFHKGYVAVSYVGGRPASGRLNLALPPQDGASGYEIRGKVFHISRKPAPGVMVGAALPPGLYAGTPAVSDTDGGFTLADLPAGKWLVGAWTLGDAGEIRTWGVQKDVKVAEGKDRKSTSPQITLRAVSRAVVLAGRVSAANKNIKPRQVQVLLVTDDGAELPLLSRAPDRDGHFRFKLPSPEEGTTYHLIASGVDSSGSATYAHFHKIAGESYQYDLTLPDLPATPSVRTASNPEWSWSAAPDVSVYRVRLETTGDDGKTLWEGWTTGTSVALPQIPGLSLKHGESYRFTLSAIKTQGAFELPEIASTPWAAAASLAPREFVAGEAIEDEAPRGRPAASRDETPRSRPAATHDDATRTAPQAGPAAPQPAAPPNGSERAGLPPVPGPGRIQPPPAIPGARPGAPALKAPPAPRPARSALPRQTWMQEGRNRT